MVGGLRRVEMRRVEMRRGGVSQNAQLYTTTIFTAFEEFIVESLTQIIHRSHEVLFLYKFDTIISLRR